MSDEQISSRLKGMHEYLLTAATALPSHQESIAEFCQSVEAS
jgi:hypothetical protein